MSAPPPAPIPVIVSYEQKLAWILVIAYTGPVGLFVFLLCCRSPGPGLHATYTKASWKQGVNSEMHCLAGDATGIIICAVILSFFALSSGQDLLIEYVAAWLTGLFIFQALMMLPMYGGNYLLAVRKTVFAETVSMNFVMAGMFPVMLLMMSSIEGCPRRFVNTSVRTSRANSRLIACPVTLEKL